MAFRTIARVSRRSSNTSLDERGVAGGIGARNRLGSRCRLLAIPQELVDEARAPPQARSVSLQTMEQGNACRVDELEAGDIQLQGPSLGEDGFACQTQLLCGFVRQATFDAKGVGALARRDPRDPHHRAGQTQVMCRRRPRSAPRPQG